MSLPIWSSRSTLRDFGSLSARYNNRASNAIQLFDALGTVLADRDDQIAAACIYRLEPGMKRHARSRETRLLRRPERPLHTMCGGDFRLPAME